jgi:hypothetical protein
MDTGYNCFSAMRSPKALARSRLWHDYGKPTAANAISPSEIRRMGSAGGDIGMPEAWLFAIGY